MATVETPEREFRAEAKYVRAAPRKAQLVVREIRGLPVADAMTMLRFMTRAAARDVEKVLGSAVANAESHPTDSYASDQLYVSAAYVGAGPTLKRWRARARGRIGRIKKRTCHITIRLAPVEGGVRPPAAAKAEAAPRRAHRPKAEAAPASAVAAAMETETKPARPPRKKAEEKPGGGRGAASETKPARAPRKKAEEAAPAAEEKPGGARHASPEAKPARAPRKKAEPSPEEGS